MNIDDSMYSCEPSKDSSRPNSAFCFASCGDKRTRFYHTRSPSSWLFLSGKKVVKRKGIVSIFAAHRLIPLLPPLPRDSCLPQGWDIPYTALPCIPPHHRCVLSYVPHLPAGSEATAYTLGRKLCKSSEVFSWIIPNHIVVLTIWQVRSKGALNVG